MNLHIIKFLLLVFCFISSDVLAGNITLNKVTTDACINPLFRKIPLTDIWEGGSWTSNGTFYGVINGSLYKSTDFLKTAGTPLDSLPKTGIGPSVKVTSTGAIIWGYAPTLRRSTDGGLNWTTVLTNTGGTSWWPSSLQQSPITGSLFISTYDTSTKKVFRSKDDGVTWTEILNPTIMTGMGYAYVHFHMITVAPNGWLYVSTGENGTDRHNLISKDDGDTWTQIGGAESNHPTALIFFTDSTGELIGLWGSDYTDPGKIQRTTNNSTALVYTTVDLSVYSGQPTDVWVFAYLGSGVILSAYSPDQFGIEWPYYIVSTDFGLTWNRVDWDQYSSAKYSGAVQVSENHYKKWVLMSEAGGTSWGTKVRSFLVTYGGETGDIQR